VVNGRWEARWRFERRKGWLMWWRRSCYRVNEMQRMQQKRSKSPNICCYVVSPPSELIAVVVERELLPSEAHEVWFPWYVFRAITVKSRRAAVDQPVHELRWTCRDGSSMCRLHVLSYLL